MDRRSFCISVMVTLFLTVVPVWAQATGTIDGTVYDKSGAVVPGAQITVTNVNTNLARRVHSDGAGKYTVPFLPVGLYKVLAEKEGFAGALKQNVELQVNTTVQVNAEMAVRSSTEQVHVTAEQTLVQSTSTTLVQVVDQKRIEDLPLNGRNVLQLIAVNAGVSTEKAGGGTTQIQTLGGYAVTTAINGSRGTGTNYVLDNGDNNDSYTNISLPFPNPDAVQEFSIQTSTFDAQYGRGVGGVVNVVTRSGTNDLHGSMFEYLRNYELNAANFFSGRDAIKRNQFGFSVGGPLILPKLYKGKDRTFLFGSYQGTRQRTATPGALRNTPSEAMKRGDFSEWLRPDGAGAIHDPLAPAQYFPGNIIPTARFDPTARKLLDYLPASAVGSSYQYRFGTPVQIDTDNQMILRMDHQFSPKQRLSFRTFYIWVDSPWSYAPGNLYFVAAGQKGYSQNSTVNHTYVISSRWLNDFTASMNTTESNSFPPQELGAVTLQALGARVKTLPDQPYMILNITGWSQVTLGQGYTQVQKNYQYADTVSYATGRHNFKAGIDFRRYSLDKTAPFQSGGVAGFNGQLWSDRGKQNAGNAFAELILGTASSWAQRTGWSELLTANYIALFAQEDIRLTPRLTANLGLRWDPRFDFSERDGKQMTFIPGTKSERFPNAFTGLQFLGDPNVKDAVLQPDRNNLAPRLGLAYQLTPRTVVRTAYGIFYDQLMGVANNRIGSGEPFIRSVSLNGPVKLSDPYNGRPILDPTPLVPDKSFAFTPYSTWAVLSKYMPSSYVQNWNLIVERQILANLLLRAGYVGSKGTHLLQSAEINPAVYGPGSTVSNVDQRRIYQPIGGLQLATDSAYSSYHSLQVTVQKRWSHGFTILGNYTWSKSIDPLSSSNANGSGTGPDPYNYGRNRGLSDFDVAHRLVVSGLWELPTLRNRGMLTRQILGGWQNNYIFSVQTGAPMTVASGVDNALVGVGANFADLTGVDWRQPDGRSKAQQISNWFNPAAFRV
ncbi:MAG TPA: TonB-dependent receptor, partial [Bryobacteraceae bacterium]|nr:TonB-dependent receptor [Bryobacteraceae bacterium]